MSIRYIGDLSAQDAALLSTLSQSALNVLEFGAGGSTQVIAQSVPRQGTLRSIETDASWIERTQTNLQRLGISHPVEFMSWKDWEHSSPPPCPYDLVFDDGVDKLRIKFALRAWPMLRVGGKFLFHDTRRPKDYKNVTTFLNTFYLEVDCIQPNHLASNITVLTKKTPQAWEDWNVVERRARWEYGHAEPPPELWGDRPKS